MVVLFLAQNIEITKFFFIETALLKSKIITIFVKLLHKSFISWNKKRSLEYTFKGAKLEKKQHTSQSALAKWLCFTVTSVHQLDTAKTYVSQQPTCRYCESWQSSCECIALLPTLLYTPTELQHTHYIHTVQLC